MLAAIQHFISTAPPQLTAMAFHARVAGNVLDILLREAQLAPGFNKAEAAQLEALLGESGADALNQKLCEKSAQARWIYQRPAESALIKTTMGKLARPTEL